MHLIVDVDYELPVAYEVTRASQSDQTYLIPMVEKLKQKHEQLVREAESLSGDKGFDSEDNIQKLWDDYELKPVIDIRHLWKDEPNAPLYVCRGHGKGRGIGAKRPRWASHFAAPSSQEKKFGSALYPWAVQRYNHL